MKSKRMEIGIIVAVAVVCIIAALILYLPKSDGGDVVASISVDGTERYRVDLSENTDAFTYRIENDTGKPVSFEITGQKIRFIDVTCPDHVCEKAGWCERPGDRAVCMPNRTTLICYARSELSAQDGVIWITKEDT